MDEFEYVVIGGGIVGLSVAWSILENAPESKVAVLEKEGSWAGHQTGRNSGVIHSGIYYKHGTLKEKLCRRGGQRLVEFCARHGIAFEVCGKVIVATRDSELPMLEELFERGAANGIAVRRLSKEEVLEHEPHVQAKAGLHVPSTGIVDYLAVSRKLAELVAAQGGRLHLNTKVLSFERRLRTTAIVTSRGSFSARRVINCAGLHSDRVARLAGANPRARIVPFRGEYYQLVPERRNLVRDLIYPVPDLDLPFLGVHFTRGIDGGVHAGPNAVLSFKREGYTRTSFNLRDFAETMTYSGFWRLAAKYGRSGLEEMIRSFSKTIFIKSLQSLIPEIQDKDLIPAPAGVRAQALWPDGALVNDFLVISTPEAIHVCNAPSPAATACLEIGRVIAGIIFGTADLAASR
jgi:L-2-hydroxyglutarate oxidase